MAKKKTRKNKDETRGRKPLPDSKRRDCRVEIRLSGNELAALEAASRGRGMSLAAWLREVGLSAASPGMMADLSDVHDGDQLHFTRDGVAYKITVRRD